MLTDRRRTIPRQRGPVPAWVDEPVEPSLPRRMVERYLLGVAEAAGVVTVAVITYAVLVWVVL